MDLRQTGHFISIDTHWLHLTLPLNSTSVSSWLHGIQYFSHSKEGTIRVATELRGSVSLHKRRDQPASMQHWKMQPTSQKKEKKTIKGQDEPRRVLSMDTTLFWQALLHIKHASAVYPVHGLCIHASFFFFCDTHNSYNVICLLNAWWSSWLSPSSPSPWYACAP